MGIVHYFFLFIFFTSREVLFFFSLTTIASKQLYQNGIGRTDGGQSLYFRRIRKSMEAGDNRVGFCPDALAGKE